MDDQPSSHSLRDKLAIKRTQLANERTLLSYGRTAIMLVASGATLLKFFAASQIAVATGWALILCGLLMATFGFWRFQRNRDSLV